MNFLRNAGNRLLIQVSLDQLGFSILKASLDKGPTEVFKLRWGTIADSSDDVGKVEEALLVGFYQGLFPTGGPEVKTFSEAVNDKQFWRQNEAIDLLASDIDVERTWLQGCPCHEDECISNARKGMRFKCPDGRKDARASQFRERVTAAQARFRHNQIHSRMRRHEDPDGSIYSGVHGAYGKLMSLSCVPLLFSQRAAIHAL